MTTQECLFCAEIFPVGEMCGPRLCSSSSCSTKSCLSCMRKYVRLKEQESAFPTCPNYRCSAPLDGSFLLQLFTNNCPLCDARVGSQCPLVSVGCALNHSYCEPCLQRSSIHQLNFSNDLPRCPRAVECKFEYDQESIQDILQNREDAEDLMLQWHERRVSLSQSAHPLYRPCYAPDCSGQLIATVDIYRSPLPSKVECNKCRQPFCWRCKEPFHDDIACLEVKDITKKWAMLLQQLAGGQVDGGLIGEKVVEDNAGIVSAFMKLEQFMASNQYFQENFESGNLKHCPSCKSLIEKLGGCESMICGQDHDGGSNKQRGCGVRFSWSKVSKIDAKEVAEFTKASPLDIVNIKDCHFDFSSYPPTAVKCKKCFNYGNRGIIGSRFKCVFCGHDSGSYCLKCTRESITTEESAHCGRGHVFKVIAPPRDPLEILLQRISSAKDQESKRIEVIELHEYLKRFKGNRAVYSELLKYQGWKLFVGLIAANISDEILMGYSLSIMHSTIRAVNCLNIIISGQLEEITFANAIARLILLYAQERRILALAVDIISCFAYTQEKAAVLFSVDIGSSLVSSLIAHKNDLYMFYYITRTLNQLANLHPPYMFDFMKLCPLDIVVSVLDEHFSDESQDDIIQMELTEIYEDSFISQNICDNLSKSTYALNSANKGKLIAVIDLLLQNLERCLTTNEDLFLSDAAVPHVAVLDTLVILTSKITPPFQFPGDGKIASNLYYLRQFRSRVDSRPQLLQTLIKMSTHLSGRLNLFRQCLECIMNILIYCRPVEIIIASALILCRNLKHCIKNEELSMLGQAILKEYLDFHDVQSVTKVPSNFVPFNPNKTRREDRSRIRQMFIPLLDELVATSTVKLAKVTTPQRTKSPSGIKMNSTNGCTSSKATNRPKTTISTSSTAASPRSLKRDMSQSSSLVNASMSLRVERRNPNLSAGAALRTSTTTKGFSVSATSSSKPTTQIPLVSSSLKTTTAVRMSSSRVASHNSHTPALISSSGLPKWV